MVNPRSLYFGIEKWFEDKRSDYQCDKEIPNPPVNTAGLTVMVGIFDTYRLDN